MKKKIGVVGAGVMGCGVAQSFSMAGFDVVLVDVDDEILSTARATISRNLCVLAMSGMGIKVDAKDVLARIAFTKEYNDLAETEAIIENVTEDICIKRNVYKKLDDICIKDCIFLVNTSCVSITKIGSFTQRPAQVIGTHFMNPVPQKDTIEAIRGYHTSDETIVRTRQLLEQAGKMMILVNDMPGFVSNRLSHLLMNEAAFVVQDQVATPEQVDDIFKKCFSHKMGPLETADLIGLDTVVDSLRILYESYQDPKYRVCPLLQKYVDAGKLGIKSGEGFYFY